MYLEARKLNLIAEIVKTDRQAVLKEIEAVITNNYKSLDEGGNTFAVFAGTLTDEEISELENLLKNNLVN